MPLTPFHCSIAYIIYRWKPRLSLPALIVSTMVPDLEIPFVYFISGGLYGRLVLHSFIGATTVGTCLSVFLNIFLYPSVVSSVFKLDKEKVDKKCRFSITLIMLCLVGVLSHVFLDSMTHEFNPLLYPIVTNSIDIFRFINDVTVAQAIVHSVLLIPLTFVFVNEIRKRSRDFWMQILVG